MLDVMVICARLTWHHPLLFCHCACIGCSVCGMFMLQRLWLSQQAGGGLGVLPCHATLCMCTITWLLFLQPVAVTTTWQYEHGHASMQPSACAKPAPRNTARSAVMCISRGLQDIPSAIWCMRLEVRAENAVGRAGCWELARQSSQCKMQGYLCMWRRCQQ